MDIGGDRVARVAAPGVRRRDRSILCRARVEVSPEARAAEPPAAPSDAEEVELLAEEVVEDFADRHADDTSPIDERTPAQGLPAMQPAAGAPADVARRPSPANQPVRAAGLAPPTVGGSALDRDVAAAARQVPDPEEVVQGAGGDDLALATAVAAAVETETDEDPEWAQLARGPEAFPGGQKPEPPPGDDTGDPTPSDRGSDDRS